MNSTRKKKEPLDRYKVLIAIMSIVFVAILSRVIYLQVFKYEEYAERANKRAKRFISDKAPRGKIYDSDGNILATNKQTYTVTFTETDESKTKFYRTMDEVYDLLNKNGEKIQDKFNLKINDNNEFYFDFNTDNNESRIVSELRFKKDRGLDEKVKKYLINEGLLSKKEGDLTVEEEELIDEYLLKITPKETFYYLVESYSLYNALEPDKVTAKQYSKLDGIEIVELLSSKYNLNDIRNYMLIKDAIKMQSFSGFKPVTLASNVKEETAFIFYQKLSNLPGVDVSLEPVRYYPYGSVGASILGYVSSINSSDKNKYEERGYDVSTDLIGKSGIESAFESTLKGTKGGTTVTVNSAGRKLDELYTLESYPGNNVHLTIDKNVQYAAEQMLRYQLEYLQNRYRGDVDTRNATRGAAVAIEVETGRVLALVSEPGFDPNMFAQGELDPQLSKRYFNPDLESFGKKIISQERLSLSINELFPEDKYGQRSDPYDLYPKPFYNYATMGTVAPGSTFKPLSSLVALEEGVFTPNETINVNSTLFTKYKDLIGAKRDNNYIGRADVKTALAKSSNSYYYEAAVRLYKKYGGSIEGLNSVAKYAWKFGLGVDPNSNQKKSTGLEIAENFGSTYNFEEFKKDTIYYSKWTLVESLEKGYIGGQSFPSVDIGIDNNDSDKLANAKKSLKDKLVEELNKVGVSKLNKVEDFAKELIPYFEDIYNNSEKYRLSIADKGWNVDKSIKSVATGTANWVINDIAYQITTPSALADASIGQGMNSFTPVQLASYIATLANGGTRYKVHLVDKITSPDGELVEQFSPEILDSIEIKESNLNAIKEGMRRVNHEKGFGTASSVFGNFPIITGGKTGTATFRNDQDKFGRTDFGVYVSFAPLNNPKVAVAVIIYDGGHGYFGAPVARAIYESYFKEEIKAKYPNYAPKHMDGKAYDWSLNPPLEDVKDNTDDVKDNSEDIKDDLTE